MPEQISIQTELGEIVVMLDIERAPITASNFLRYIDDKRYETATFYRVVRMDNQPDNDIDANRQPTPQHVRDKSLFSSAGRGRFLRCARPFPPKRN